MFILYYDVQLSFADILYVMFNVEHVLIVFVILLPLQNFVLDFVNEW